MSPLRLSTLIALCLLTGCCDLDAVDYTPLPRDDWPISAPEDQGLDPDLVAELFCEAEQEETLYGVVVIKGGHLVAEGYFNDGGIDQLSSRASVTKSYTSALVGRALELGCLSSVGQRMMDFFPEYASEIDDPRKEKITLHHLLQMRSGYPWEESEDALWDMILSGDYLRRIVDIELVAEIDTEHHYSNLSSHWLGVIVERACDTDLRTFAEEELFAKIDAELGPWSEDIEGHNTGAWGLEVTARDMARFGQLYLDGGTYQGERLLPADWIQASHSSPGPPSTATTSGPEFSHYGYGYQWWSAYTGGTRADFAWGHGGSFIFLVRSLDLVISVTADPFIGEHSEESWEHERAHLNLVGRFIKSLPRE